MASKKNFLICYAIYHGKHDREVIFCIFLLVFELLQFLLRIFLRDNSRSLSFPRIMFGSVTSDVITGFRSALAQQHLLVRPVQEWRGMLEIFCEMVRNNSYYSLKDSRQCVTNEQDTSQSKISTRKSLLPFQMDSVFGNITKHASDQFASELVLESHGRNGYIKMRCKPYPNNI